MKKPPAFQFYAKDFLMGTLAMTLAERGAYVTLLSYQWDHGAVPEEEGELARVLGCRLPELRRVWPKVRSKFVVGDDGQLRNDRLEVERRRQHEYRQKQRENGQHGGRPSKKGSQTQAFSETEPTGNPIESPRARGLLSASAVPDPATTTAPPERRTFPQPVENLPNPSWKQAMAIAFKVVDGEPESASRTPAFKAKCIDEGLNPNGIGGEDDPRPLYARAIEAAEAVRAKRRRMG